ncbi:MAG: 2,4'-dihydroxyacetophenone dioxygenase family protein [Burkholderiales bacterium]|nr:2,4'-dihydroxyacetophenone dioxygenase family protein [Burkholderiales bacterium]
MINIQNSAFTRPEMFLPDVMTMDGKWYPLPNVGNEHPLRGMVRPVLFDVTNGGWVSLLKAEGKGTIQRHRHAAAVTAWTIDGSWGYREHDWLAKPGSFVYEPAGHIHTLFIDPEVGHMTALFHVYGPVIHLDPQGNVTSYDDVYLRLDRYMKHCKENGIGEDWVRSLIR